MEGRDQAACAIGDVLFPALPVVIRILTFRILTFRTLTFSADFADHPQGIVAGPDRTGDLDVYTSDP